MRWSVPVLFNDFIAAGRLKNGPYIGGPMGCADIFFYLIVWVVQDLEDG